MDILLLITKFRQKKDIPFITAKRNVFIVNRSIRGSASGRFTIISLLKS